MRNSIVVTALTAFVLAGAGGCKKNTDIPVGVNLPLSDSLSAYGKATLEGVKLRARQINDAGGVNGMKIRLEIQDNRGKDTDTRSSFKKFTGVDGVVAVLGPITSTRSLAAKMDAPPSYSSSLFTDVTTAWRRFISPTASPTRLGSS